MHEQTVRQVVSLRGQAWDAGRVPGTVASIPGAMPGRVRIAWIDYAKGLAMLLVVYGHSFRGLRAASLVAPGSFLSSVDYLIYCFHMPLFFFLSGMLAARPGALLDRGFWIGRLGRIVWPYLLWMSVELLLLSAFSGVTTMGEVGFGIATYLADPISPFWFLYALCLCHVFTHLLFRLGPAVAAAAALAVFGWGQVAERTELVHLVTWGLLWFVVGRLGAPIVRSPRFTALLGRPAVLLGLAAATLAAGLLLQAWDVPDRLNVPAALAGCGTMFCLAQRMSRTGLARPAARFVLFVGVISLTVLVTHVLGTAGARIVLLRVFHVRSLWLHLPIGVAAGLALPVAVQLCFARLGLLRLAGLPHAGVTVRRGDPAVPPP